MLLYNGGIFAILQSIGLSVKQALPEHVQLMVDRLPETFLLGYGVETIKTIFVTSPFKWLLVSVVASMLLSFVGKVVRFVFTVLIIGAGLYLTYIYLLSYGYLS